MRNRRMACCEPLQLRIGRMHVVSHDGAPASQVEALIYGQVVPRPGKSLRHLRDFGAVLVQMRLDTQSALFPQQRLADFQHRLRGRKSKAWSDGVRQATASVKSANQSNALAL